MNWDELILIFLMFCVVSFLNQFFGYKHGYEKGFEDGKLFAYVRMSKEK